VLRKHSDLGAPSEQPDIVPTAESDQQNTACEYSFLSTDSGSGLQADLTSSTHVDARERSIGKRSMRVGGSRRCSLTGMIDIRHQPTRQ
jgi:hypothetical protein